MYNNTLSEHEIKQIVNDFYRHLQVFFNTNGGFVNTKQNLHLLFYSGFSSDFILRRKDISPLRLLQRSLNELLEVIHFSHESGVLETLPQLPEEMDQDGQLMQAYNVVVSGEGLSSRWNFFPRHLTKKEFVKPSVVFDTCFRYKTILDWKIILEELFSSSLLHESVINFSDLIDNPIQLYDYSFKLLEVLHLILLRYSAQKN